VTAPLPLVIEALPPEQDVLLAQVARAVHLTPDQVARCCVLERLKVIRAKAVALAIAEREGR